MATHERRNVITFRIAALIHKHATQQQRRIIIPGISLAAAALVAAVLFLVSIGPVGAENPGIEPGDSSDCAGIGSSALAVVVDEEKPITRTVSTSDDACSYSLTVTPPATTGMLDCQIDFTPESFGQSGVQVKVTAIGDCEGVTTTSRVEIDALVAPAPILTGGNVAITSGFMPASQPVIRSETQTKSRQALAKIIGSEIINVPMFLHYAKAYWSCSGNLIESARPEIYAWTNNNWHIHQMLPGSLMNTGSTIYRVWLYMDWHSDGYELDELPDVYASSKVTVWAFASGNYACDFVMVWGEGKGKYPKLHHHEQCWAN